MHTEQHADASQGDASYQRSQQRGKNLRIRHRSTERQAQVSHYGKYRKMINFVMVNVAARKFTRPTNYIRDICRYTGM